MDKAYEEIKRCLQNNEHNVSTETLQLALEALREVKEQGHHGFSNYPTFTVVNVIDNDEETYKEYYGLREDLIKEGVSEDEARTILQNALRFDLELQYLKLFNKNENDIFQPILNDIIKEEINFYEIANHIYKNE